MHRFKNSEGKLCDSAAENAKALETHFEKVYNILSDVDGTVIDELRQRPVRNDLDCVPSDEEMSMALQKAKKNKSSGLGDSQIPVEFWQALEGNVETEMLFKNCIHSFRLNEGLACQSAQIDPVKGRLARIQPLEMHHAYGGCPETGQLYHIFTYQQNTS